MKKLKYLLILSLSFSAFSTFANEEAPQVAQGEGEKKPEPPKETEKKPAPHKKDHKKK